MDLKLNNTHEGVHKVQQKDPFCRLLDWLHTSKLQPGKPFYIESELLMRNVADNIHFQTVVLPRVLVGQVLRLPQDELGHSGTIRTYMLVHRLYYWKGPKVVSTFISHSV